MRGQTPSPPPPPIIITKKKIVGNPKKNDGLVTDGWKYTHTQKEVVFHIKKKKKRKNISIDSASGSRPKMP